MTWQNILLPRRGHSPDAIGLFFGALGPVAAVTLLSALLIGWSAEIKLGSQLGAPPGRDQAIVPSGLIVFSTLLTAAAFGGLEWITRRRAATWAQRLIGATLTGLGVGLVVLIAPLIVTQWREASRLALILYLALLTLGAFWVSAARVRDLAPPPWRRALHPVWPPVGLGLLLVAAAALVAALTDVPVPSQSLATDAALGRASHAAYPPIITTEALPRVASWEGQRALLAEPPSEVGLHVQVPPSAQFSALAGIRPSLFVPGGGGVRFQIAWTAEGQEQILYDRVLTTQNVNRYGERAPVDIDLTHLSGRQVQLIFRTIPVGIQEGVVVEAAWLNPRLIARASLAPSQSLLRDGLLCLTTAFLLLVWLRRRDVES